MEFYFRFRSRPVRRNLHDILHHSAEFRKKIEAHTAEIWRHIHFSRWRPRPLNTGFAFVDVTAFRRSKSISKPNFVEKSHLIGGWDIATFGLEIQTSAILEFYFRFRSRPFRRNRRVILHPAAEFHPNRQIRCQNMTSYRFSIWRPSARFYLLWSNGGPPTKCVSWSELSLPIVRRINSSGDIAIYRFWRFGLKLPILGSFGAYFLILRHSSSWPPKGPSLGGSTSFEPYSVRICESDRPGHRIDKKDRITKKLQKCYISPIFGNPTGPIRLKSCMAGDVHDIITCAKFKIEIFMGYNFTGGRIFDFPIDFCIGLTTVQR